MNENVDIFICTHKDFDAPTDSVYKIVCGEGELNERYDIPVLTDCLGKNPETFPKKHGYCECSKMNFVRRNVHLKDFVGFAHYHRYLDLKVGGELVDIPSLFSRFDIIIRPGNVVPYSARLLYDACHFIEHLDKAITIGCDMFPDYRCDLLKLDSVPMILYYNNVFVMRKDDFLSLCDFCFGILSEFDAFYGFKTDADIEKWVTENIARKTSGDCRIEYQSRVEGFLFERLLSVFVNHNYDIDKIGYVEMVENG